MLRFGVGVSCLVPRLGVGVKVLGAREAGFEEGGRGRRKVFGFIAGRGEGGGRGGNFFLWRTRRSGLTRRRVLGCIGVRLRGRGGRGRVHLFHRRICSVLCFALVSRTPVCFRRFYSSSSSSQLRFVFVVFYLLSHRLLTPRFGYTTGGFDPRRV